MRRRVLSSFGIGCLVVLAGCTGALSGASDAGGPTLEDVSYPPGVSDDGANVTTLVNAHAKALNGSSFTFELTRTENNSLDNRSVTMWAAVGADRQRVRANVSEGDQHRELYLTEETNYVRSPGDDPEYRAVRFAPASVEFVMESYPGTRYVNEYAAGLGANFTPTGVRVVDGTPLIVLEPTANASALGADIPGYDATILVDERGVIRRFEMSAGDQKSQFSLSMEVTSVNETTVEEPSWLDEAKNQTSD